MNVITLGYDRSYINEATQRYLEEGQRYRLEQFAHGNASLEFPSRLEWIRSISNFAAAVILSCVVVSVLFVALNAASAKREMRGKESGRVLSAAGKASDYVINVATIIVFLLAIPPFLVNGFIMTLNGPYPTPPDKPGYEALLDQTISESNDKFDEAAHLAADQVGIDLAEACENGKSRGPAQDGGDFTRRDNHRLIQCGGDRFGTLLYADLENGEFKSIGTSSGAEPGKVIATSGYSVPTRNLSSVRFDGSKETRYKPSFGISTGWSVGWAVDDGDDSENERPFAPEDEVTLEEAKSAESA